MPTQTEYCWCRSLPARCLSLRLVFLPGTHRMKHGHKRDQPSRGSLSAARTDVRTRLRRTKTEKNKEGVLRVGAVHKLPGKGRLLPNTLLLTTLSCVVAVVVDGLPRCMPGVLIWSLQERWTTFEASLCPEGATSLLHTGGETLQHSPLYTYVRFAKTLHEITGEPRAFQCPR